MKRRTGRCASVRVFHQIITAGVLPELILLLLPFRRELPLPKWLDSPPDGLTFPIFFTFSHFSLNLALRQDSF